MADNAPRRLKIGITAVLAKGLLIVTSSVTAHDQQLSQMHHKFSYAFPCI
jgi:hypothetical protein